LAPFILSTTSVKEEARSLSLAGSKDISHLFKELLYLFFFFLNYSETEKTELPYIHLLKY